MNALYSQEVIRREMRLRKITVNNRVYLWKREHVHLPEYEVAPCVEKVTVYLSGNKKSPLRLFFKEDDNKILKCNVETAWWCLYGAGDGGIWLSKKNQPPGYEPTIINLNRPLVIKNVIVYFEQHGWHPDNTTRPMEIKDALKYLDIIDLNME